MHGIYGHDACKPANHTVGHSFLVLPGTLLHIYMNCNAFDLMNCNAFDLMFMVKHIHLRIAQHVNISSCHATFQQFAQQ